MTPGYRGAEVLSYLRGFTLFFTKMATFAMRRAVVAVAVLVVVVLGTAAWRSLRQRNDQNLWMALGGGDVSGRTFPR